MYVSSDRFIGKDFGNVIDGKACRVVNDERANGKAMKLVFKSENLHIRWSCRSFVFSNKKLNEKTNYS